MYIKGHVKAIQAHPERRRRLSPRTLLAGIAGKRLYESGKRRGLNRIADSAESSESECAMRKIVESMVKLQNHGSVTETKVIGAVRNGYL